MRIYIDKNFKCRSEGGEGLRECESDIFEGKCKEYIEGYRYVPEGESWTRGDGVIFKGEMAAPWRAQETLDAAQSTAERIEAENAEELAELVEMIYTNDMKEFE